MEPTAQQELDALRGQSKHVTEALEGIQKRIAELEADTTTKKK
jgi:hypothetical protein